MTVPEFSPLAGVEAAQAAMEHWRDRAEFIQDQRAVFALKAWLDGVPPDQIIEALKLESARPRPMSFMAMFGGEMEDEDVSTETASIAAFGDWLGAQVTRLIRESRHA